ncbi:hypothetical protein C1J03_00635 [Sulfitobacter sp. SK012]|uniref:hypothetical protein n=1 Tax=Sulfitobacter sp. SK012 TaxID=1389005 RepID=UPI000E0A3F59|nr:hypothetical protein [Sulfitobacter sp. SK012]AXI44664.1 hypothetical protein C1J03_00635 [Sulfitobacter sp. SK012]
MSYRKELLTAVGTLGCAIGIGFVMQGSEAAKERYGKEDDSGTVEAVEDIVDADQVLLNVLDIELTSAEFDTALEIPAKEEKVKTVPAPASVLPEADTLAETAVADCDIEVQARAVAAAMVNLTMQAPCFQNERLTVHHNGMMFSQVTDDAGLIDLIVPALEENAVFVLAFPNGDGGMAQTTVDQITEFERVVLQWRGQNGFEIHAREFGADYDSDGHVWSGASRDSVAAVTGLGGFITRYGNDDLPEALMAEIYTFPIGNSAQSGDIDLTVEAEVTTENCGLEIEAQTLQTMPSGETNTRSLTLSVPDCDAVGTFLVLNNLLEDMKVAGR